MSLLYFSIIVRMNCIRLLSTVSFQRVDFFFVERWTMFCVHINLIIYISVHIIFKFPGMFLFWFLVDISNSLMSLNMVFLSYWKEICLYYTCIRNDFQIGKRLIWCCGKSQNKKNSLVPLFVDAHQPTKESWHF